MSDPIASSQKKPKTSPIVWGVALVLFAAAVWFVFSAMSEFNRSSKGYDEMLERSIEFHTRNEAMFKKQVEDIEREKQRLRDER